jgi:pyridoxal phosphate enzyme (YggS family)
MEVIEQRLYECRQKVDAAARASGRLGSDISIVCVTKQAQLADVITAFRHGCFDIGENRLQEARRKHAALKAVLSSDDFARLRWHCVGHLQTNKSAKAARLFSMIQSVDSVRLAEYLNAQAGESGNPLALLVQVNISQEQSKSGISFPEVIPMLDSISALGHVRVHGLMGIGPFGAGRHTTRACFRRLREVFDEANVFFAKKSSPALRVLSMGMSDDYECAIEEGSTMVRIGRAIFGG